MHIGLSEILTCPRCRSPQGLVVMVDELDGDGRVRQGDLGCPRCERRFPVEGGVVDLLRGEEEGDGDEGGREGSGDTPPPEELAVEVGALLDARALRGAVVLGRGLAAAGPRVAELADDARLLCLGGQDEAPPEGRGASRCTLARSPAGSLPVLSGKAAGVALWRPRPDETERGRTALAPGGRLAALRPDATVRQDLASSDLEVVASEERAAVVRRPG